MTGANKHRRSWRTVLWGLPLLAAFGATGCQIDVGGPDVAEPLLPDRRRPDFAPASEMKLAKEAAAQKAYAQEQAVQR